MGNEKKEYLKKGFFPESIFGNENKKKFPDIMESIIRENNISSSKKLTNEEKIKITVEFIEAIINKNYDLMVECFSKGADINYKTERNTPFTKNYHLKEATPIFYAIRDYDEKIFNFLVRNGADVNVKDTHGDMPIFYLVDRIFGAYKEKEYDKIKNKLYESLKLLIENGAELNNKEENVLSYILNVIPHNNFYTIDEEIDLKLMKSVKKISEEIIGLLIDNGANLNIKDKEGITPLMKMVELNRNIDISLELIEKVLEKEIDINACDEKGKNVLNYAIEQGRFEKGKKLIELLIEKGADVNVIDKEGITPLILATQEDDVELVKLLVENGAKVYVSSYNGIVPFILAVKKRNMELIELFIQNGADINAYDNEGKCAIHYVMEDTGNRKLIELFIEKGANVNQRSRDWITPLMLAADNYPVEVVKLLRKKGAKVDFKDKKGRDALACAILSEKVDIVKNLLEVDLSLDFDRSTWWREKGLRQCCEQMEEPPYHNKNHFTLCNDKGYILQDKNGNTHLMVALETKNQEIIKSVFEACYNEKHFFVKNNNGENILHKAVLCGNKEMVELLISKKMNLNEQNGMFHTALMIACYRIHDKNTYEIAKLLIDAGADITIVNEKDESALSLISKVIMGRINGDQWKLNKEIFEIYEILNKKIMDIVEYRNNNQPDEEFIKKKEKEDVESLPF